MEKNRYYLIARNKKDNTFKIIHINNSKKNSSLEEIDLYTTGFSNDTSLILKLYGDGFIDSFDVDIFITCRGKENINYLEVLYNHNNSSRYTNFRNISNSFRNGDTTHVKDEIAELLDNFAKEMFFDDNFYEYIMSGSTNVYSKFIQYFSDMGAYDMSNLNSLFSLKYKDGAWATKSYILIRNIMEAMETYYRTNFNCISEKVNEHNRSERDRIKGIIYTETSDEAIEGQLNLFDYMTVISNDSSDDKLLEIISILGTLPRDTFVYSGDKLKFNDKKFVYFSDEAFPKFLDSSLDSRIIKAIYLYTLHNHYYKEMKMRDESTLSIEEDLRDDIKNIRKLLSVNEKKLNNAYAFCKLYNRCVEDDLKYRRIHNIKGDNNEYVYTRRENN